MLSGSARKLTLALSLQHSATGRRFLVWEPQDSIKASFNCILRVSKGRAPQILRVLTFKWIASVDMFGVNKKTAETDSVAVRIGIVILLMTGSEKVRWTGEN